MRNLYSAPARFLAAFLLMLAMVGGVAIAQTAEPNATPDAMDQATAEATTESNATLEATVLATAEATAEPDLGRQDFTVDFGDFQAPAELTYPPGAAGPLPVVILIPGSGPADMDFTLYDFNGSGIVVSHIFRDIANSLSQHGYAVLRYNKHYVAASNQVDWQKFAALDLNQMQTDAEKVVAAARANPLVDPKQVYLYGWSEGSTVAAAMVAKNPSQYAGLIVQGAVAQPWRDLIEAQIDNISVPYIKSFAPDGKITPDTLKQAYEGNGGLVAKEALSFLVNSGPQMDAITLNPAFDTNKDDIISADELSAGIKTTLDAAFAPGGYFGLYAPDKALPSLLDQAAKLTLPVLILQGERDGNVDPTGALDIAGKLAASGNHQFHVVMYPTLGHSLGEVDSPTVDNFPPIAAQPLADTQKWLDNLTGLNPVAAVTATPSP